MGQSIESDVDMMDGMFSSSHQLSRDLPNRLALSDSITEFMDAGYVLLRAVFGHDETEGLAGRLFTALRDRNEESVLRSRGRLYGSRNLIETFPEVCSIPRHPILQQFVTTTLGSSSGLVRALYFDKPPDRSWSLPWHRDRTIAVKCNDVLSDGFRKPTMKSGIPHVEAPDSLLANMLTLRVHLDAMTAENGPLSVIPGSHVVEQECTRQSVELNADAGDVLVMRPLLSHSSRASREGTTMHRRVVHLEFAPQVELPDGFEWHSFHPVAES